MKKLLLLFIFSFSLFTSHAQFKTLLTFNDTNGSQPWGSLTHAGGVLYGMTQYGGAYSLGEVFKIGTNGTGYKDLLDFSGPNGRNPFGSLTLSGGVLYGMTCYGGAYRSLGLIFKIDTNGTGFKDLLDFDSINGENPEGSLTLSGGVLYGMTELGGPPHILYGSGNIFKIDTNGTGFKNLLDFNGTNGKQPWGSLTLSAGVLYGMTEFGGAYNDGLVFKIDTNGTGYKDLLDFNGTNGSIPNGSLTLSGGVLYGMTSSGGAYNDGLVFKIDTNGTGYKDILDFSGKNGKWPSGSLTLSGGVLFGMTANGGTSSDGNIFKIDTNGTGYTDMFDFNGTNGANPSGDLTLSGGVLYGMTEFGGANNDGIVFSLDTSAIAGINALQVERKQLKVYPNPTSGITNLQLGIRNQKAEIEVYNILGEKVLTQTLRQAQGDNEIDLSKEPAGVYFVRVTTDTGTEVTKVIKE